MASKTTTIIILLIIAIGLFFVVNTERTTKHTQLKTSSIYLQLSLVEPVNSINNCGDLRCDKTKAILEGLEYDETDYETIHNCYSDCIN